jgi:membrane fusion protein, multidrug efflux system
MNSSAGSRRWAESPSSRELRRFSKRGCSGVKKGDLLYQLEQPPFQAQVDAAKANVDQLDAQHRNAQISLARAKDLLEKSAGPQSNYDSALAAERALAAQIDGAEAQLKTAEINLGYTEIRAPIDGKISSTGVTAKWCHPPGGHWRPLLD